MATPADSDLPRVQRPEPPPPSFLEQGVTAAAFAVHTFLVDVLLIGETPLGDLLPMFKRVQPHDEASEMGQTFGDMAALAWGLTEVVAGVGIGLGAAGVEGLLCVVPGGQVVAALGLPVAGGALVVAAGLVVHGGLTAVVAGSHLREPRQYMNKNQGQGGGAPPKEPAPSSSARRPQRPQPDKWIEKGGKVQNHPDGRVTYTDKSGRSVTYSREGYPDFKEAGYVKDEVTINMKGNHTTDPADADRALKALGRERPPNTTWHHHEDGKTMQLVDRELHKRFCHTGGVSGKKHGG